MGAEWRTRSLTPADLSACFEVQKQADVAAFPHIFPPERFPFPDDDVRHRWAENLREGARICVGAFENDELVGHAVLIDELFDSLAVVPSRWGTGVAGVLHDELLEQARARGATELHLWVLEQNARARRFYERRGWLRTGDAKTLPFPPHPQTVGYRLGLTDPMR